MHKQPDYTPTVQGALLILADQATSADYVLCFAYETLSVLREGMAGDREDQIRAAAVMLEHLAEAMLNDHVAVLSAWAEHADRLRAELDGSARDQLLITPKN